MKKHTLIAETRTEFGRKTKKLRKDGIIPGTVYGKKLTSESISVRRDVFAKVYADAGETGLIELTVGKTTYPVLVNTVQTHPVNASIIHIEFHKVDLKEKVHANVPIELTGVAQAVADRIGVLLTLIDEVEVEALPTDLPEQLNVDVTKLASVNDEITVSTIHAPAGVTILTDPAIAVVRVAALVSKQAEVEAAQEAAAQAEAKVEAAETVPQKTDAEQTEAPKTDEAKTPPEDKK